MKHVSLHIYHVIRFDLIINKLGSIKLCNNLSYIIINGIDNFCKLYISILLSICINILFRIPEIFCYPHNIICG